MLAQPSSKKAQARRRKENDLPTPGSFSEHQLWTREDFRILRQYYPTKGSVWVARKLGRTREAVKIKAGRIGLPFDGMRTWTKKEVRYLCRNYHKKNLSEIAEALNRTVAGIAGQVARIRLKAKTDPDFPYQLQLKPAPQSWTKKDLQMLRRHYGSLPTAELAERLGRSPSMIRNKASQLGLTYPHLREPKKKKARGFRTARTLEEALTKRQKDFILKQMAELGCGEIARRLDLPHSRVLGYAQLHGYNRDMAPKRWKPQEIEFLRTQYSTMLVKDIAAALGRTAAVTVAMAGRLGLPTDQGIYVSTRHWSAEDEQTLRELYPIMTLREIADRLGRSVKSIRARSKKLELHRTASSKYVGAYVWTPEMDAQLRALYGTMPYKELASALGRTCDAVSRRAVRLGLASRRGSPTMPHRPWTPEEDAILRRDYRRLFAAELAEHLGRTAHAVTNRAKDLGLSGQRRNFLPHRSWTGEEDAVMRKLYGKVVPEELAVQLGRTQGAITSRARTLGLHPSSGPRLSPNRRWTPEEEELLRKEYGRIPGKELAERLGRSVQGIRLRAVVLGISESRPRKLPQRHWTEEEDAKLRKDYGRVSVRALAEELGRTEDSVKGRARELGIRGKRM